MALITNKTFDEITIGDSDSLSHTITKEDIQLFAIVSGDVNPAHLDEEYAKNSMFKGVIAHGMWGASLISAVLGTKLPGPGTIYLGQDLKFTRPVKINDTITATLTVKEKKGEKNIIILDCVCTNQDEKPVILGTATVIAPTAKEEREAIQLPKVELKS